MVRNDILEGFNELFGTRQVNGREINVEETIATLTRELRPAIADAMTVRRTLLNSTAPVHERYGWPKWDESFEDPASGSRWSFHQIVTGLIDNFQGRESAWRWRLNDEVDAPVGANPLKNPGLELTGPWHPLDMAFNALNSSVSMNMPDFEDASPSHFEPNGQKTHQPVGVFAALKNAKEIFAGDWTDRPYQVTKKGQVRSYRIDKPSSEWPTRFMRPPGLHIRYAHIEVDGYGVPGTIAVVVLWTLNNYEALKRAGTGVYFYFPKNQSPEEALIVETLLSRLEAIVGVPVGTFKIKILYEEGAAGLYLPAIAWTLRRRLLGMNVGRWDYLGSLIEMWKDDPKGVFPDPQSIGMASPNMIAYQRYNALLMLMAGMKDGRMSQGGPIGGMAAMMIYPKNDVYGRAKYNPIALRAIAIDKLRERLIGLMFVPDGNIGEQPTFGNPTLDEISSGKVQGRLFDAYRQSWVASPEAAYVAAGNAPLRASIEELQAILDAPFESVEVDGKPVPTVASGLSAAERQVLESRGLLNSAGKITPRVLTSEMFSTPEKLLSNKLWESIYSVPQGEITIERIQHAFYMTANYGFQILNGNFAAAIDDYELKLRFMNDLATYRINVSWLWTLVQHQAVITRDGYLKRATLTADGVELAQNAEKVAAGTLFSHTLFEKVFDYHDEWTAAFFAELDRKGDSGRFDRSKAPIIMELLKKQLLSPRYIQHSARLLFLDGESDVAAGRMILDAVFDQSREELVAGVKAGTTSSSVLAAYDYVYDIFAG